jgi:hypothetical protein
MRTDRPEWAREVRSALVDPMKLCTALGLLKGFQPQARGLLICCPWHGDRTPSCSVTVAPDGTVRVKCFACQQGADAIGLIAQVRGLSTKSWDQFREVLAEGASIAGRLDLEDEIRAGRPAPERKPVPLPPPAPERGYPDEAEVTALWSAGGRPDEDPECSGYLAFRRIDPVLVSDNLLCRVIPDELPPWARYHGRTWAETGHRMVTRVFDAAGTVRSVRAIRVRPGDSPKRLPPGGHKASGVVLANKAACALLRGRPAARVVIVEGEPDFLCWATRSLEPVIGILSGSWGPDFAERIPSGATVVIRVHQDAAGDKYAEQIIETLRGRPVSIKRECTEAA